MTVFSMLENGITFPVNNDFAVIDDPASNLDDIISVKVLKIDHPFATDAKRLFARFHRKNHT